jgi:hypothetical protein
VIDAVRELEASGIYDETLAPGDKVRVANGVLADVAAVLLKRTPAAVGPRYSCRCSAE